MKRIFIFVLLVVIACVPKAQAQADDVGSWLSIQANKSLNRCYAMARLEYRAYDNLGATECYFVMAGGGYNFTKWLKADLSYEFWKLPSSAGATKHKGVAVVTGSLSQGALTLAWREKYEISFDADGSIGHTLRSRLRAQYRFGKVPITPYVMYEFFNGFGGRGWVRSLHYAGTEIRLGRHSALDVFYMYNLHPQTGGGTTGCHTFGVGYSFSF